MRLYVDGEHENRLVRTMQPGRRMRSRSPVKKEQQVDHRSAPSAPPAPHTPTLLFNKFPYEILKLSRGTKTMKKGEGISRKQFSTCGVILQIFTWRSTVLEQQVWGHSL